MENIFKKLEKFDNNALRFLSIENRHKFKGKDKDEKKLYCCGERNI